MLLKKKFSIMKATVNKTRTSIKEIDAQVTEQNANYLPYDINPVHKKVLKMLIGL